MRQQWITQVLQEQAEATRRHQRSIATHETIIRVETVSQERRGRLLAEDQAVLARLDDHRGEPFEQARARQQGVALA